MPPGGELTQQQRGISQDTATRSERQPTRNTFLQLTLPRFLREKLGRDSVSYQPLFMGENLSLKNAIDASHAVRFRVSTEDGDRVIFIMSTKTNNQKTVAAYLLDPNNEDESAAVPVLIHQKDLQKQLQIGSPVTFYTREKREHIFAFGLSRNVAHSAMIEAGAVVDLEQQQAQVPTDLPKTSLPERTFGWEHNTIAGTDGKQTWDVWEQPYLASFILTPQGKAYFASHPESLRELIALRREEMSAGVSAANGKWEVLGSGTEGVAFRLRGGDLVVKVFNDPWNRAEYSQNGSYARDFAKRYEELRQEMDVHAPAWIKMPQLFGLYTWNIRHAHNNSSGQRTIPLGSVKKQASEIFLFPYISGVSIMALAEQALAGETTAFREGSENDKTFWEKRVVSKIRQRPITYDDGMRRVIINEHTWERILASERRASESLKNADNSLGPFETLQASNNQHDGTLDESDHATYDRIVDFSHPTADSPFTLWIPDPLIYSWRTIESRSGEGGDIGF